MSALTMLGLAVMGAVLYTLFQKSAPAFSLFVSMGAAVLVLWKISAAAQIRDKSCCMRKHLPFFSCVILARELKENLKAGL